MPKKQAKIQLEFDSKFFRKEHIMLAAQEYTGSFWILVDGSDDSAFVVLIPKEGEIDPKLVEDEFRNYVFSVIKGFQFPE